MKITWSKSASSAILTRINFRISTALFRKDSEDLGSNPGITKISFSSLFSSSKEDEEEDAKK